MALIELAVVLHMVAGGAQGATPANPLQPAPDSAAERRQLRSFSMCLAEQRPDWARDALSRAYLSDEQRELARESRRGTDPCMSGREMELMFRYSTMVGSLAEHFIRQDLSRVGLQRVSRTVVNVAPLNTSEDFGLCVVARNPVAARDLALSDPGSGAEAAAARRLAPAIAPCTRANERLSMDLQSLRALTSVALYRGLAMTSGGRD
jgi:hypothetical protein